MNRIVVSCFVSSRDLPESCQSGFPMRNADSQSSWSFLGISAGAGRGS